MNRAIALSVVALAWASTPAAAQTVGIIAAARNSVEITSPANPVLHRAAIKERVALGNDVVTGNASAAQLLLLDQTSFSVGANARVRIDRFVYDPARGASSLTATVTKGAFRFMSSRALRASPGQSSVHTPVASIGIRGTIVEGVVGADAIRIARSETGITAPFTADEATASLIVLRGPGRNAQGAMPGAIDVTAGGMTVALADAGLALFVPGPNQVPIGPFRLSGRGLGALNLLLRAKPLPGQGLDSVYNPMIDRQFEIGRGANMLPGNGFPSPGAP